MRFSLFSDARDTQPKPREGTWEAFCDAFTDPSGLHPHPDPQGALGPTEWKRAKEEILAWSPAAFSDGSTRANKNVETVSAFVADLDDIPIDHVPSVLDQLEGLECFGHTTPGAVRCSPGLTRLRVIVPFSVPVTGKDWPKVWGALARRFRLNELPSFDATCKGAAWLYFVPCAGANFFRVRGTLLDPHEVADATPRAASSGPLTRETLRKIGDKIGRSKNAKKKVAGETLVKIARGVMYADHPNRDEAMRLATFYLAQEMPGIDPDEFLALAQESMNAEGALPDDPDKARVRGLLEGALDKVKNAGSDGLLRTAFGEIKPGVPNCMVLLARDVALGFDLRRERPCFLTPAPWGSTGVWSNEDGALACAHFANTERANLKPNDFHTAALAVSKEHPFDPFADYLATLVWDQTSRLDTAAFRWLGAEGELPSAVLAKTLIAAVARALHPPAKVDHVLILVGSQGIRKSGLIRELAGEQFFVEAGDDLLSKDALMRFLGRVFVEIEELAALNRAELERLKGFVTREVDVFRAPYAAATAEHPRRFTFIGTTNSDQFLEDPTGNRRWWTIRVTKNIDLDIVRAERDQIWGEAVHRYHAGEPWWLEGELARGQEAQADQHRIQDPWEAMLADAIPKRLAGVGGAAWSITTESVLTELLGVKIADATRTMQMRVGKVLKALGYERKRVRVGSRHRYVFLPPAPNSGGGNEVGTLCN